ncbi:amidohydrolase [Sphingosinicella sp. CPCC 101087]|uniref:amidohydrolase n=1 Tax=Sphingosinicella sp. CPCC 101087 TaxID=2497754 RepID=UPI00101BB004|nr:amidohydrolase [Sphingosinicella sp. CPCC 101087]
MRKWMLVAAFATWAMPAAAQDRSLRDSVARDYRDNLGALFDHFHRNPELSGREVRTAERMAQELRALGYEVTTGVGGTGVVAVLRNGEGPTVLLRADMDGLPLEERSGLPNASTARQVDAAGVEQPVMHACGHDVHITALVGAARQLIARRGLWSGTAVLIAQPAEETISGARTMVEDGLYTRFPKPEYALAFHVSADMPAGRIEVPDTIAYSSADSVSMLVRGIGTHGASPHQGVDPVLVAAQIVISLQSMVGRDIAPLEGAVISVGSIHGGVKSNIIPEQVELQMTVRADTPEVRAQLLDGIDRVARGTALALGVPEDRLPVVTRSATETTPPTINDPTTAARVREAIAAAMGRDRLFEQPRTGMGAEDFAYFVTPESGVKGVYFAVGGTPPDEVDEAPGHHSPLFRIQPEPAVTAGVEAMVVAAEALMPRG